MKSSIQAAIFQFPVVQGDLDQNLNLMYQGLRHHKADLIVLPELCTTGYFLNKVQWRHFSNPNSWNTSIDSFTNLAKICNSHLCVTLPKMIHQKLYNIGYLINEDGIVGAQAKIHITDEEKRFFTANPVRRVEVIPTDFGKMGILSCFDLWDSVLFKQIKAEKASLICSPCAFASEMSPNIAKSRALEFSTPILLSNRTGTEIVNGFPESFIGMSSIWDASGNVLTKASQKTEYIEHLMDINETERLPFCQNLAQEMGWA
jgi:predicted amidohydrolase